MTPQQRDRDARAVAALSQATGFSQPVAPLVLRRVPDVDRLLRADDATLRRVLGDPALRGKLRSGLVASFRDTWKQAALERMRLDHTDWLRAWWLPVATAAELDRLVRSAAPRSDHRRVALHRGGYPTACGAAEVLTDASHRSEVAGYLVVERRVAVAILDLAHEVARDEGTAPGGEPTTADVDRAPDGIDPREHPHVAWWHGG